jgi:hypothetical protein
MGKDKEYDLVCEQGATLARSFAVRNDNDTVFPLEGYEAKMQTRRKHGDREVLLEASTENGRLAILAESGEIKLLVDDETTVLLPAITGVYDIVLTDAGGVATRLLEGKFIVRAGVTKP